jgi:hypothetical protein
VLIAAAALACACAVAAGKKAKGDPMSASTALADFLGSLEKEIPLDEAKLASRLRTTFKAEKDVNRKTVLVASTFQPNPHGIALASVRFRPARKDDPGELLIELAGSIVDEEALKTHYKEGNWRPPPPPGWAPEGAGPTYIVDRPWGEIWFTFQSGTVRRVAFSFGQHSGSGV